MKKFLYWATLFTYSTAFGFSLSAVNLMNSNSTVNMQTMNVSNNNAVADSKNTFFSTEKNASKQQSGNEIPNKNAKSPKDQAMDYLQLQRKMEVLTSHSVIIRNSIELPNVFTKTLERSKRANTFILI